MAGDRRHRPRLAGVTCSFTLPRHHNKTPSAHLFFSTYSRRCNFICGNGGESSTPTPEQTNDIIPRKAIVNKR